MSANNRELFLAAGSQSGGTTLLSWCFLQRPDMGGILDLYPDVLTPMPAMDSRSAWAKATISAFTLEEIVDYYEWQGWNVRPLLIVRDVRDAYQSLQAKWYGPNGTTAEDPPLRTRFSRLHASWRACVDNGWPVICFERLVDNPESELRAACAQLGLEWDPAMLDWPKSPAQINTLAKGNETLLESVGRGGMRNALIYETKRDSWPDIPAADLFWLEQRFADMLHQFGYPRPTMDRGEQVDSVLPTFEVTRRAAAEEELAKTRANCAACLADLNRVIDHPVIGRLIRAWGRWANRGFEQLVERVERRNHESAESGRVGP